MYKSILFTLFLIISASLLAQVPGTKKKYVRISALQSHFSAYGSERAWNNSYYEGLRWPADYLFQDNSVIRRSWIATDTFTDSKGRDWDKYGIYFALDYVGLSLFPVELKQSSRFGLPDVFVDGINTNAPYKGDIDTVDTEQIADRIITNTVNTSMGLTVTRKVHVFSQQYHDNYFIKEFTYTNTGNTDYDADIELTAPLKGVRISWGTRYSLGREAAFKIGGGQSYGKHSWVTRRGENYADHMNDVITEANPVVDWIRSGFSWAGQSDANAFDNIGAPDVQGNGRLVSPHHTGTAILHVDKSATDQTDDPAQPAVLGWHAGDTYPALGDMVDENQMKKLYSMMSGNPHKGLGGMERFDEKYYSDGYDPYKVHNDGGGTNIWVAYGPFDLEHGESITIVEVEGINGLSRQKCEEIGARWKKAYENSSDKGPFILPDASTTDDKDVYKNAWVYTGKDSILKTFGRAKRNYDLNYAIPQPPNPPSLFEVNSGGDRISLTWSASASESDANFGGYRIYRAVGKPDTTFEMIYENGAGTANPALAYSYDDKTPQRGFSYYYYISSFTDGSNNATAGPNPAGQLESSRFYTKTNEAAFLRRKPAKKIEQVRVVPNPYHISAQSLQFNQGAAGDQNRIMFLNLPAFCTIKIFTERGDLVETLHHTNGSGDEAWNSVSSSRQIVASGVYIALIEVSQDYNDPETQQLLYKKGEQVIRKFIIIR